MFIILETEKAIKYLSINSFETLMINPLPINIRHTT